MDFSITTDFGGDTLDAGEIFPVFAAAGFKAVHWCQNWARKPVLYDREYCLRVKRLADENGLRVADIHAYSGIDPGLTCDEELFLSVNANRMEFANAVGADVLVVHLPLRRKCELTEAVDEASRVLGKLRAPSARFALRVAVENLGPPACVPEFFDALFGRFEADFLGFCYDSGHALMFNCADFIRRYGHRLIATHLHDNDGSSDQHRLPGEGKVDWPMVVAALKATHYARPPNLETNKPPGVELEAFCKQAMDTIRRLFE